MSLMEKLCIIGVGLIGGSVGKAARERGVAGRVFGLVPREEAVSEAQRSGAVDAATADVQEAVSGAQLVVICTPVKAMGDVAGALRPFVSRPCVVTDTGSTKAEIVERLEAALGGTVPFVGGHPVAGSEKGGVSNARADLFQGQPCILTVTRNTERDALSLVASFWRALGSNVSRMQPAEHDAVMARVSHLPHLVAAALVNSLSQVPGGVGSVKPFMGGGLRDSTRIAASPENIWVDICASNRAELLESIKAFEEEMSRARKALASGDKEDLRAILLRASKLRIDLDRADSEGETE